MGGFDGKFRFYRNFGADKEPKYAAFTFLKAGEEDAKVPIYCCIGSSPYFVDFDNDGNLDFISGCLRSRRMLFISRPGAAASSKRETLVDKSGKPILLPGRPKASYESFGSWPVMVDWNNDGKL